MANSPDFREVVTALLRHQTQAELAERLGISQSTISRLLSGKAQHVSGRVVAALARHYPDLLLQAIEDTNRREEPTPC